MHRAKHRTERRDYFVAGVVLSLLGHLFFILPLLDTTVVPVGLKGIDVEFIPPPIETPQQVTKPQIVTEPDSREEESTTAKFLAEKSRVSKTEQIKRGESPEAAETTQASRPETASPPKPAKKTQATTNPTTQNKSAAKSKLPGLRLDQKTLREEFSSTPEDDSPPPLAEQSPPSNYRAFSRPPGSGARFMGQTGSADFLPELPDGDITLLNTKANKYAVFVRRVATQVFSQLRVVGWDNLRINDIRAISKFSRVRAVLSKEGELLEVTLEESSGSAKFDRVLIEATQNGARDPNPPPDAVASDGHIHFIFLARSWAQVVPSGRSGVPTERRWLLLSTGLE